jgi:hypothetical protein
MAALVAVSTKRLNFGSVDVVKVNFSSIDDGDTYASGMSTNIVGFWFQQTDNPTTQASAGSSVANSSGTFTFYPGEEGASGDLYILTGTAA